MAKLPLATPVFSAYAIAAALAEMTPEKVAETQKKDLSQVRPHRP